jgi:VanZ family protein
MKMNARTLVWYWMPVIAWMSLIFLASTDLASAQHTSRFIGPFLSWIVPNVSPEATQAVQFFVRKAAHVTEYAILAALLLRAFSASQRQLRGCQVSRVAMRRICAASDRVPSVVCASRTRRSVAIEDRYQRCSARWLRYAGR